MTPQQIELTRKAAADLRTVRAASSNDDAVGRSIYDLMDAADIAQGFIDIAEGSATGFSGEGIAAIKVLANTFRPSGSHRSRQASNATLSKFLTAKIARDWKVKDADSLSEADFRNLEVAIDDWFSALSQTRLHAVPCVIMPYGAPALEIGPVRFHHMRDFPFERFGLQQSDFWTEAATDDPQPRLGGSQFDQLLKFAAKRGATWVAIVEITGRADNESVSIADIAVDIALAGLQIAAPGLEINNISRATARIPVVWHVDNWLHNGEISSHNLYRWPGMRVSPDLFAEIVQQRVAAYLKLIGHRLAEYLGTTSIVPDLNETWCNAAYWFHEAIAESLETVAVVKLETAIEVLFRAENMNGSKSRIIKSFEAIFGLGRSDIFPASGLTVEQFTLAVTTARSRL